VVTLMRRALLLLLLFTAAASEARSVTLYVQRVVVADPGPLKLGDLVQPVGDSPLAAGETMALAVATVSDRLLYIPSRTYSDSLEAGFGQDSIIVGSRSLVVPRGAFPPEEMPILDKLLDFLADQGILGSGRADMEVRLNQVPGTISRDSNPVFQLIRSSRGIVEVSVAAGTGAGVVSGKVVLVVSGAGTGAPDVKSSDPVHVVFHKGSITIEMDGRALSAAAIGDSLKVQVPESQKSFVGRLSPGKAVNVDLP